MPSSKTDPHDRRIHRNGSRSHNSSESSLHPALPHEGRTEISSHLPRRSCSLAESSDRELFQKFRDSGDQEAFAELERRYGQGLKWSVATLPVPDRQRLRVVGVTPTFLANSVIVRCGLSSKKMLILRATQSEICSGDIFLPVIC